MSTYRALPGLADREAGPEPYRLNFGPSGDRPSLGDFEIIDRYADGETP